MKRRLENILDKGKEMGRKSLEFVKDNAEIVVMIGAGFVGGYLIDKAVPEVNAADIQVYNWTTTTGVNPSSMDVLIREGYNEGYVHNLEDVSLASPPSPALEIYSEVEGNELSGNGLPLNTPGADVKLRKKGLITPINNSLWVIVTEDTGLEHRDLVVYDNSEPNVVYPLNKTVGDGNEIPLPDIVDMEDEVYANWHIGTPSIVPGDITDHTGVLGALDGKYDLNDLAAHADMWLETTVDGENYSWGDTNYDRENNFKDLAITNFTE